MSDQLYDGMPIPDVETGETIGHVYQADDGSWLAVDLDGTPTAAADAYGNDLDPAEFDFDAGDADPAADFTARLDALEQMAANPPVAPMLPPAGPTDEQFAEMYQERLMRDAENLEAAIGRKLTDAEFHRVMADHHADATAGVAPDAFKSAAVVGLHDNSTHEGRVQYATERLADGERERAGVDYTPEPQPSRESYDLDKPEERHALMADKLNGADVEGLSYRSSELATDLEGMD